MSAGPSQVSKLRHMSVSSRTCTVNRSTQRQLLAWHRIRSILPNRIQAAESLIRRGDNRKILLMLRRVQRQAGMIVLGGVHASSITQSLRSDNRVSIDGNTDIDPYRSQTRRNRALKHEVAAYLMKTRPLSDNWSVITDTLE